MKEIKEAIKWYYAKKTIVPRIKAVSDSFGPTGYDRDRLIELYATCLFAFDTTFDVEDEAGAKSGFFTVNKDKSIEVIEKSKGEIKP